MLHQLNKTQNINYRKAFTLIEIMIVVLIMSVLMAMANFSFRAIRSKVRETSCIANMRSILNAAIFAQTESADISNLTVKNLVERGYLKQAPKCPSGGKYWVQGEQDGLKVTCVEAPEGIDHGYLSEYE